MAGPSRHSRARPTFSVSTRPASSRIPTCFLIPLRVRPDGSASWLSVAGPRPRRSRMPRRLGSESAKNVASSVGDSAPIGALYSCERDGRQEPLVWSGCVLSGDWAMYDEECRPSWAEYFFIEMETDHRNSSLCARCVRSILERGELPDGIERCVAVRSASSNRHVKSVGREKVARTGGSSPCSLSGYKSANVGGKQVAGNESGDVGATSDDPFRAVSETLEQRMNEWQATADASSTSPSKRPSTDWDDMAALEGVLGSEIGRRAAEDAEPGPLRDLSRHDPAAR